MKTGGSAPWQARAAYFYLLRLPPSGWAWEYLRRNPDYRSDWQQRHIAPERTAHWGQRFADPDLDARSTMLLWTHAVDSTVHIDRAESFLPSSDLFEPWHLPGRKWLMADAAGLSLTARIGSHTTRWHLGADLKDGDAYAYVLPAGAPLPKHLQQLRRHLAVLGAARSPRRLPSFRPSRAALVHMRTIQALDGALAGASHREIAVGVFGREHVAGRWHPDSELRAQVRHMVHRGRQLMLGDYRRLLERATRR